MGRDLDLGWERGLRRGRDGRVLRKGEVIGMGEGSHVEGEEVSFLYREVGLKGGGERKEVVRMKGVVIRRIMGRRVFILDYFL